MPTRPRAAPGATPVTLAVAALLVLAGCGRVTEHSVGLTDAGSLTDCPDWPRCVSSQAEDPDKLVAPLRPAGDANLESAWAAAREVVAARERTEIVELRDGAGYLRAEVTSPWGVYTDDLELLRDDAQGVIHVRSSARIGYYDFDVNAERVADLRADLAERGVVIADPSEPGQR